MQTKVTETSENVHGAFEHTKTLKVRRRPGMSGAYHRMIIVGRVVAFFDTGWTYVPKGQVFKWWIE